MSAILVFGSNLAGIHGAGAAREAHQKWGAVWRIGEGLRGNSYAIPTKDEFIHTLPVDDGSERCIAWFVGRFVRTAAIYSQHSFLVTAIGCGLAGHDPRDIAPLFAGATENVFLSEKLVAALRPRGNV